MTVAANNNAIISVHDLVAGFGGQTVLDGLSLDVRAGEILGVVGGSGAGKSVLLRSIIGLVHKQSGRVRVFDVDADDASEREWRTVERRWGVLFQNGALFSSLTALENIQFPMRQFLDLPQHLMDDLAIVKLELVGLSPDDATKYPAELSGGMTKRVGLARALALDPGDRLSRRADVGSRPDRRRRIRRADPHAATHARHHRFHGYPRSRQPERRLRSHRGAGRGQDRG